MSMGTFPDRETVLKQLDNPIWHALSTAHASFAEGDGVAKRYPVDISPMAATNDQSPASYEALASLPGPQQVAALFLSEPAVFSVAWTVVNELDIFQMVWSPTAVAPGEHAIEELAAPNVEEMLALTELTKPGPFRKRTHELGSYRGIRQDGELVAMAGERLRMPGLTEISAVCTHPKGRGRGYASSLISSLIRSITERGEIPFLHLAEDNLVALRVYEALGFKKRRSLHIAVIKREPEGTNTERTLGVT